MAMGCTRYAIGHCGTQNRSARATALSQLDRHWPDRCIGVAVAPIDLWAARKRLMTMEGRLQASATDAVNVALFSPRIIIAEALAGIACREHFVA